MLCEATERAMLLTNSSEICVCGGVAQSPRLRSMLSCMAEEHGSGFGFAPDQFNADNGAMVAFVGEKMLESGMGYALKDCVVDQRYRIDRAEVRWE